MSPHLQASVLRPLRFEPGLVLTSVQTRLNSWSILRTAQSVSKRGRCRNTCLKGSIHLTAGSRNPHSPAGRWIENLILKRL